MLYLSNLVKNTTVHSIVCRRFNPPSIDNHLYSLDILSFFAFFCSIFPRLMLRNCNKFLLTERNWLLAEYRTLLLLNSYTITKEKQCTSSTSKVNPPNMDYTPIFTGKSLSSPLWFLKNLNSPINKDGRGGGNA